VKMPEPNIRYCGGCNPRYDRVKTAARIKEALMGETAADQLPPLSGGKSDTQITLVICGCQTACVWRRADKEDPNAYKITSKEDAENVIAKLSGREDKARLQGELK